MKNLKPMQLSFWEKLTICWEILQLETDFSWILRDKERYLFNKGYKTGMLDQRLPGEYKVIVHYGNNQSNEYKFGCISEAVDFAQRNTDILDNRCCELFQTYLDRDLYHLL